MALPNTQPIYSKAGLAQWMIAMTAANTNTNINSGTSYLIFTADATNGSYVPGVYVKTAPGSSSSFNTAATVVRVWLNNGSTPSGAASNNVLIGELGLPATTFSNTAPQPDFYFPINRALPPGYQIYISLGTAPGSSGEFMATVIGGKY